MDVKTFYPMRKYMIPAFAALLVTCAGNGNKNGSLITADSLFALKNISVAGSNFPNETFKSLDSAQKMQLMAPVLFKDKSKEELDYFIHFQSAKFVAKQKRVFDYTPVIVSLTGDDYDALFYILTDDNGDPVSALQIAGGGICGGPTEISDTLMQGCPERISYLNGKEIITCVKRLSFYTSEKQYPSLIDSVTYTTKILPNGSFETQQKDSTRYSKLF